MSDLIRRADAIEAMEARIKWFNGDAIEDRCKRDAFIQALDALSALPSVDAIALDESCEDCPLYDKGKHNCPRFNKVIPRTIAEAVQGETVQVKQGRKKIYIAGPVTGVDGYEETFAKAADDLRARGYEPVNPVAPGLVEGYSYRDYINRGFQMLMECDGMLLLPGYMDSKGAALELHYALAVGMEIIKGCDYGEN